MGGKSGGSPPPTTVPDNSSNQMELMGAMFQMMQAQASAMPPASPELPAAPEIKRNEPVDWTQRQTDLASKARADYKSEQDRKHGRQETIHTSPLDDDEDNTSLLNDGLNKTKV